MARPTVKAGISHISRHGALLVFPLRNRSEPLSLWRCFYPRTEMVWEWTDDVDDGVVLLWHLRSALSSSDEVVYAKWFQGRATFFSPELFTALLNPVASLPDPVLILSPVARRLLEILEDNSPLPTRRLREEAELVGKENEGAFAKGMKELWGSLLIVGYGEQEEGGFPSLCVGATSVLFEELWDEARTMPRETGQKVVDRYCREGTPFRKWWERRMALVSQAYRLNSR